MSGKTEKSESDETETDELGPTSERWDPLGADNEESDVDMFLLNYGTDMGGSMCSNNTATTDPNRIRNLEEEQEILTSSLMALTSHFAQVQFRLRQIVEAPAGDRDNLLKNLEEFAFRGIPEITGNLSPIESDEVINNLERARQRQFELIDRLKRQLTELEKFAYESGAPVLPQSVLLEKQKIIIDELKCKLNLNVNEIDLPQLSSEDLRNQVDSAFVEFVGPLKMKEQLVAQLKTQITDLERFIAFLQCDSEETKLKSITDGTDKKVGTAYNSYSAKKKNSSYSATTTTTSSKNANSSKMNSSKPTSAQRDSRHSSEPNSNRNTSLKNSAQTQPETLNSKAHSLLDKASTLLQMFAVSQFGCGSNRFQKNTLKKSSKINHWGDTRAQLEVDIQEVLSLAMALQHDEREKRNCNILLKKGNKKTVPDKYDDYSSESDESADSCRRKISGLSNDSADSYIITNVELTTIVRRNFAVTLQKLIQHGLLGETDTSRSLVPFIGCFNAAGLRESTRGDGAHYGEEMDYYENSFSSRQMHAWELILEYYNIKNGEEYNETPARKLSESFNLDIVGGTAVSNKQSLLTVIGSIIAMHSPYKRSYNSHFKAFVCAGLNSQKLVLWLTLILQCSELINTYYASWSYVARTGFRDALRSIDRLSKYDFDLPVDLAVRQFQNIKDVFM